MPDFGDVDPNTGLPSQRTQDFGTVDPNAPSVANGQISPEEWEAYRRKRKRDAIIGIVSTLGGMLGAQPFANAIGIGAGAGGVGSAGASASVPGAVGATEAPLGMGTVVGGASGAGIGGGAVAGGVGAGSGVAKNILDKGQDAAGGLFGGMEGRDIAALVAALTGTIGGALTDRPNNTPTTQTLDPALSGLVNMQTKRLEQQQPLYESILAMANGLLPTQYQRGGGPGAM